MLLCTCDLMNHIHRNVSVIFSNLICFHHLPHACVNDKHFSWFVKRYFKSQLDFWTALRKCIVFLNYRQSLIWYELVLWNCYTWLCYIVVLYRIIKLYNLWVTLFKFFYVHSYVTLFRPDISSNPKNRTKIDMII